MESWKKVADEAAARLRSSRDWIKMSLAERERTLESLEEIKTGFGLDTMKQKIRSAADANADGKVCSMLHVVILVRSMQRSSRRWLRASF